MGGAVRVGGHRPGARAGLRGGAAGVGGLGQGEHRALDGLVGPASLSGLAYVGELGQVEGEGHDGRPLLGPVGQAVHREGVVAGLGRDVEVVPVASGLPGAPAEVGRRERRARHVAVGGDGDGLRLRGVGLDGGRIRRVMQRARHLQSPGAGEGQVQRVVRGGRAAGPGECAGRGGRSLAGLPVEAELFGRVRPALMAERAGQGHHARVAGQRHVGLVDPHVEPVVVGRLRVVGPQTAQPEVGGRERRGVDGLHAVRGHRDGPRVLDRGSGRAVRLRVVQAHMDACDGQGRAGGGEPDRVMDRVGVRGGRRALGGLRGDGQRGLGRVVAHAELLVRVVGAVDGDGLPVRVDGGQVEPVVADLPLGPAGERGGRDVRRLGGAVDGRLERDGPGLGGRAVGGPVIQRQRGVERGARRVAGGLGGHGVMHGCGRQVGQAGRRVDFGGEP